VLESPAPPSPLNIAILAPAKTKKKKGDSAKNPQFVTA
jgi:hypothetical protein